MKIQFDHQTFSLQQYGGISRYFSVIQNHILQNEQNMTLDRGLLVSRNHYLPENVSFLPAGLGRALVSRSRTYSFNQKYAKFILGKNNFDVFHPTYYDAYFLPFLKKPFVLTVHDMTHEIFPEFFPVNDPFITFKRKVIEKADHIIAISASTCRDLQDVFGVDDKRISTIHHGFYNANTVAEPGFSPAIKRFVLYVGDRSGYKNFKRFITAVALLIHREEELSVVCVGGGSFNLAEKELLHRNRITDNVFQMAVSDSQLKTLYQKAIVFVYPSLYEGFGLPVLEAFSNNCPVAVSNTSCFPEVGGNAVVYFDPYDPDDILSAMKTVIHDETFGTLLAQKGQQQLNNFTLKSCMEQTMAVYQKLGGNHNG